jgi:hypothetical protein
MRRVFLAGMLLLSLGAGACDICGCSTGSYFIGPFPVFHHHFFGTRYTFRSFKSSVSGDPSQFSKDLYQTIELWGGWNLGRKWQVLGFVPYNINKQTSDDGMTRSNGLGDISVMVNYNLLDRQSKDSGGNIVHHQLWIGGGLKIPTGKFSPDPNDIIPSANNQAGTGSVDYLMNLLYAVQFRNWGINCSINYKVNRKANGYQFGDRLSSNAFVYHSFDNGRRVLSPNAGILFENLRSNKLDGEKVPDSGGNALLAAGGLEIGFQKISIGFNAQVPLLQNLSNGQTEAKLRGMVHLSLTL